MGVAAYVFLASMRGKIMLISTYSDKLNIVVIFMLLGDIKLNLH